MIKRILVLALMSSALLLAAIGSPRAHCEIPCGIYDDSVRVDLLLEHITTMEKSMNQIADLSAAGDKNYNQLIRWVTNKEDHANQFQDIVSQYFLTQRIKPVQPGAEGHDLYVQQVARLHEMLVYAMKCKQTTDAANIARLRELVNAFATAYFAPENHAH